MDNISSIFIYFARLPWNPAPKYFQTALVWTRGGRPKGKSRQGQEGNNWAKAGYPSSAGANNSLVRQWRQPRPLFTRAGPIGGGYEVIGSDRLAIPTQEKLGYFTVQGCGRNHSPHDPFDLASPHPGPIRSVLAQGCPTLSCAPVGLSPKHHLFVYITKSAVHRSARTIYCLPRFTGFFPDYFGFPILCMCPSGHDFIGFLACC